MDNKIKNNELFKHTFQSSIQLNCKVLTDLYEIATGQM